MNYLRRAIDSVRNLGKEKFLSPAEQEESIAQVMHLLTQLDVSDAVKEKVLHNARATHVVADFARAIAVLSALFEHILKHTEGVLVDEVLKGAHVIVHDEGELFQYMQALDGAAPRASSHFGDICEAEMGISCGRILPEILLLLTSEEGKARTHFQLEASPWRPYLFSREGLHSIEHILHSLLYFGRKYLDTLSGRAVKNLGPYGWSEHHDLNPIELGGSSDLSEEGGDESPRDLKPYQQNDDPEKYSMTSFKLD